MNVLVIEDHSAIRKLLKKNLTKKFHCTVIEAENGEEGISKIKKEIKPDLIITDIMMPKMDGFNFIREFRIDFEEYKNVPILVLSAKKDKSDVIKAIEAGANDYIIKPFNVKDLLKKIEKLLEEKK